ncbi:hypothetical protein J6590_022519 [Homalodisca vitripennis]|nr:hypothetical protein J6590_022519 [Homalodisca vitripennis]
MRAAFHRFGKTSQGIACDREVDRIERLIEEVLRCIPLFRRTLERPRFTDECTKEDVSPLGRKPQYHGQSREW